MHSRKSLLFKNEHPWVKKDKDNMFDVTMGCWDGAEVCELTGAYILGRLTSFFNISNIGLYRDDGLAILKATSGSEAERIKKKIVKVFKDQGQSRRTSKPSISWMSHSICQTTPSPHTGSRTIPRAT